MGREVGRQMKVFGGGERDYTVSSVVTAQPKCRAPLDITQEVRSSVSVKVNARRPQPANSLSKPFNTFTCITTEKKATYINPKPGTMRLYRLLSTAVFSTRTV